MFAGERDRNERWVKSQRRSGIRNPNSLSLSHSISNTLQNQTDETEQARLFRTLQDTSF
jgi:hypothetical protein